MVIADFQVKDKTSKPKFFRKTFLIAEIKFEMILGMLFLKISNANILFNKGILMLKTYTTNETLPTIKQVQIIDPKEFVIAAFNINSKMFVVHIDIEE